MLKEKYNQCMVHFFILFFLKLTWLKVHIKFLQTQLAECFLHGTSEFIKHYV